MMASLSWNLFFYILSDKEGRWASKLVHQWPVRKTTRLHCLGLSPPLGWHHPPITHCGVILIFGLFFYLLVRGDEGDEEMEERCIFLDVPFLILIRWCFMSKALIPHLGVLILWRGWQLCAFLYFTSAAISFSSFFAADECWWRGRQWQTGVALVVGGREQPILPPPPPSRQPDPNPGMWTSVGVYVYKEI